MFHEKAEAFGEAVRLGTMGLWGALVEGTDEDEINRSMGANLAAARLPRALRVRDEELTARLERLRVAYAEISMKRAGKSESLADLKPHERLIEYLKVDDADRVAAAMEKLRDRIRSLLDEVDPLWPRGDRRQSAGLLRRAAAFTLRQNATIRLPTCRGRSRDDCCQPSPKLGVVRLAVLAGVHAPVTLGAERDDVIGAIGAPVGDPSGVMRLERYAHAFAEAQLGASVPMAEAIAAARAGGG